MQWRFAEPTQADIIELASRMRACDRLECEALGQADLRQAVAESVDASEWACAAFVDGALVSIGGVSPQSLISDDAAPWMLSVEGIERYGRGVLAHAPRGLAFMQERYQRLSNVVHAHNRTAIRFIRWCGFSIGEAMEINGEQFLPFSWERGG